MGTFALAMSFAGNDLVNFIGVPLAGLDSYQDFHANGGGASPDSFMMTSLMSSAKTPPLYLMAAGVIMIIAMATSKKARNVIKTSVDLARQDEGDEMFGSNRAARAIVRSSQSFIESVAHLFPSVSVSGSTAVSTLRMWSLPTTRPPSMSSVPPSTSWWHQCLSPSVPTTDCPFRRPT